MPGYFHLQLQALVATPRISYHHRHLSLRFLPFVLNFLLGEFRSINWKLVFILIEFAIFRCLGFVSRSLVNWVSALSISPRRKKDISELHTAILHVPCLISCCGHQEPLFRVCCPVDCFSTGFCMFSSRAYFQVSPPSDSRKLQQRQIQV